VLASGRRPASDTRGHRGHNRSPNDPPAGRRGSRHPLRAPQAVAGPLAAARHQHGAGQAGFLWFGTQFGLNRYDGYHFKIFKHGPDDPGSPFDSRITSLFVDRSGTLWVGCDYALDRYDPLTESFVHYQLAQSSALGGQIKNISQDRAGALWVSTGNGLYRLEPTTGKTIRFGHDNADASSLSSDDVRSSGEDRAGTFWVATSEGLDAFDRDHARVTEHVPLPEARDFSFYEDRTGVFWVLYASGNGLAILDRTTKHLTRYSFGRENLPSPPLTGVSSMVEDQDGTLWIGTFSDGLLKYDRVHHCFIRYRNDPASDESLTENRITTLLQDREKNIWVAFGATSPRFFRRSRRLSRCCPSIHGIPPTLVRHWSTGSMKIARGYCG